MAALKLTQLEQEQALESEIDETKIMFRLEEEKRINEIKRKHEHLKAKHEFDRAVTELHFYEEEDDEGQRRTVQMYMDFKKSTELD